MFLLGEIHNNIKMIELVKKRPALYNSVDIDRAHIGRLWQEVATEMGEGTTANDVKKRWNSLRNGMSRYLRNQKKRRRKKKWYFADHLEFLREFWNPRSNFAVGEKDCNLQKDYTMQQNKTIFPTQDQAVIIENIVSSGEETNNSNSKRSFASLSSCSINETKRFAAIAPVASVPITRPVQLAPPVQPAPPIQPALRALTVKQVQPAPPVCRSAEENKMIDERNMTFFRSIIPDLLRLSERQQRLYKQNVLRKLNTLLNEE